MNILIKTLHEIEQIRQSCLMVSKTLSEVEKYLKICLEIKDKFKLKNLDNQFKSFSKINNKLSLINTLLEKTLSTPDSYDNLEIKVIANSIKKEVLPKIEKI